MNGVAGYSPAQPPLPTPSPFSFSVASTRLSSRPPIQTANLLLRFLSLALSFGSALSLIAQPSTNTNTKLKKHPELMYCFIANIFTVVYAAYQIFKIICDVAHRGVLISDKASDYISFILDQLAGYLLVSASSVAVPVIQQMDSRNSLRNASLTSVCMSFASFVVSAVTTLLSGYKLCKRIMW